MGNNKNKYTYVVITYNKEEILKDECYIFQSEKFGLSIDPHNNNDVPFSIGSNQTIFNIEDSPYIPKNEDITNIVDEITDYALQSEKNWIEKCIREELNENLIERKNHI